MRCDWRNDPTAPTAVVMNLDTGKPITFCALADEETGEYIRFDVVEGDWQIDPVTKRVKLIHGQANLAILPIHDRSI